VHPQSIPSDNIMLQKLEYIHNNPHEAWVGRWPGTLAIFLGPWVARRRNTRDASGRVATGGVGRNGVLKTRAFPNGSLGTRREMSRFRRSLLSARPSSWDARH